MRTLVGEFETLAELYAVPPEAESWLRVNMVSTVDGAATGESGDSKTINNDADKAVFDLLREQADVLVSPSFHEGLCVPIVEGYRAGCRVIGSDAGNLPYLVQPPDPVVPVGDADALAAAMIAVGRDVLEGSSSLPPGVDDVVAQYSRAHVRAELERAVRELTASGVAAT